MACRAYFSRYWREADNNTRGNISMLVANGQLAFPIGKREGRREMGKERIDGGEGPGEEKGRETKRGEGERGDGGEDGGHESSD